MSLASPNRGCPILRVVCEGWEARTETFLRPTARNFSPVYSPSDSAPTELPPTLAKTAQEWGTPGWNGVDKNRKAGHPARDGSLRVDLLLSLT